MARSTVQAFGDCAALDRAGALAGQFVIPIAAHPDHWLDKRHELGDAQWQRIAPLLAGKAEDPGRGRADNRLFVNGELWVLRTGAKWHDLPERYGKR